MISYSVVSLLFLLAARGNLQCEQQYACNSNQYSVGQSQPTIQQPLYTGDQVVQYQPQFARGNLSASIPSGVQYAYTPVTGYNNVQYTASECRPAVQEVQVSTPPTKSIQFINQSIPSAQIITPSFGNVEFVNQPIQTSGFYSSAPIQINECYNSAPTQTAQMINPSLGNVEYVNSPMQTSGCYISAPTQTAKIISPSFGNMEFVNPPMQISGCYSSAPTQTTQFITPQVQTIQPSFNPGYIYSKNSNECTRSCDQSVVPMNKTPTKLINYTPVYNYNSQAPSTDSFAQDLLSGNNGSFRFVSADQKSSCYSKPLECTTPQTTREPVYTLVKMNGCKYCDMAIELLNEVAPGQYRTIDKNDPEASFYLEDSKKYKGGRVSFPTIYKGGAFFGGYDQLKKFYNK